MNKTTLAVQEHKLFSDAYIDGLVQESRNSSVLAMELRLSGTNPLIGLNRPGRQTLLNLLIKDG